MYVSKNSILLHGDHDEMIKDYARDADILKRWEGGVFINLLHLMEM
jgi:hypothetical protein